MKRTDKDIEVYRQMQKDPFLFIKVMYNLTPQKILPKYRQLLDKAREEQDYSNLKLEMFEPFIKGDHITWQQAEIVRAVKNAINGIKSKKISIKSGHGIGKSTIIAILIIWFLFCYLDAQVPCTAPTKEQMEDILWKELSLWLRRLPDTYGDLFEWSTGYLRVKERPESWFARAKTARKEKPEALAGVHSDHIFMAIDEASGVADEIFEVSKGALTNENIIYLMISNPTRTSGYFYDSQNKLKAQFQVLGFNSEESPIVDEQFMESIIADYGIEGDEYRIRVKGEFPDVEDIDDKGYVFLLNERDIRDREETRWGTNKVLGIDPAGEGKDKTTWVLRDEIQAKIIATEDRSTGKSIAVKTATFMTDLGLNDDDVIVDSFGEGVDAIQELGYMGYKVQAINVGKKATKDDRLNLRAEYFWKLRDWILAGGELITDRGWKELLTIKYRRNLQNKIQIMPKLEMKKLGYKSPNNADGLMLTFAKDLKTLARRKERQKTQQRMVWNPIIGKMVAIRR